MMEILTDVRRTSSTMRLYSGAAHKMADTGYSATVGLPNAQQHKDS